MSASAPPPADPKRRPGQKGAPRSTRKPAARSNGSRPRFVYAYDPQRAFERAATLLSPPSSRAEGRETDAVREVRAIAKSFAPMLMKLIVGVTNDAMAGRPLPHHAWRAVDCAWRILESAGIRRGVDLEPEAPKAHSSVLDKRAASVEDWPEREDVSGDIDAQLDYDNRVALPPAPDDDGERDGRPPR